MLGPKNASNWPFTVPLKKKFSEMNFQHVFPLYPNLSMIIWLLGMFRVVGWFFSVEDKKSLWTKTVVKGLKNKHITSRGANWLLLTCAAVQALLLCKREMIYRYAHKNWIFMNIYIGPITACYTFSFNADWSRHCINLISKHLHTCIKNI